MTELIRLPAPLLFCIPLAFFWTEKGSQFLYTRVVLLICISSFLYEVVGLSLFKSFFGTSLTVIFCGVYFSYFVGFNRSRFIQSVWIFYSLLLVSTLVMVANHYIPAVDQLRGVILGGPVFQSPAGLSITQFSYGYQLAAFVTFAVISTFVFKKSMLLKLLVFISCAVFVFLGMQRSAFISFALATSLFLILYYRFKALLLLGFMVALCLSIYMLGGKERIMGTDNIVNKNEHNDEASNRSSLAKENLRIYAQYPYGLIFYGKNWYDVIYRNYVFSAGITSHNAYLMFITYLGPFLGIGMLAGVYLPVKNIIMQVLSQMHEPGNPLILCLIFSFISVSINALSHNPWLFTAEGSTLFSFFSILHWHKLEQHKKNQAQIAQQAQEKEKQQQQRKQLENQSQHLQPQLIDHISFDTLPPLKQLYHA